MELIVAVLLLLALGAAYLIGRQHHVPELRWQRRQAARWFQAYQFEKSKNEGDPEYWWNNGEQPTS